MFPLLKTLYRYIKKRTTFWMLVTAAATAITLPWQAQSPVKALWLMLVIMAVQMLLGPYNSLYNKIHALEWAPDGIPAVAVPYRKAIRWLPLLILVHLLWWPAAWLLLALTVLWLIPPAWRLLRDRANQNQRLASTLQKIQAYGPLLAVHVSGRQNVAYQVNQWIPVLEALEIPTVIISRERANMRKIGPTALPLVHARNAAHVEAVLKQGIRTVLYPANPMKNVQALRHAELNHFFINHGESDKVVNQSKLLMAYDKLLVGGPLAEQRLRAAGLPVRTGQIEHVGRPQAEMLLTKAAPGAAVKILLYAPTWEGFVSEAQYSSVGPMALEILQQLSGAPDCHVLFKSHPYTGLRLKPLKQTLRQIRQLCQKQGWEYIDPSVSIHDVMNRSDLLITDISSVLNEYLVTNKPIILCVNEQFSDADLETQFPSSAAAYKLLHGGFNVATTLAQIRANDPLAAKREWVRGESLGRFEGSALERFKSVIQASLQSCNSVKATNCSGS